MQHKFAFDYNDIFLMFSGRSVPPWRARDFRKKTYSNMSRTCRRLLSGMGFRQRTIAEARLIYGARVYRKNNKDNDVRPVCVCTCVLLLFRPYTAHKTLSVVYRPQTRSPKELKLFVNADCYGSVLETNELETKGVDCQI